MRKHVKIAGLSAFLFVLGFFAYHLVPTAKADFAGGREQILACRILSSDYIRIVSATSSCDGVLEEPLSWRVGPEKGTEFPFICDTCYLSGVDRFAGRDLTNAWLYASNLQSDSFAGSDLSGANMQASHMEGANFAGATIQDTNFSDSNLYGVTGMDTATGTAIWSYTVCPDGTNSDDNSGTCVGHF